MFGYVQPYRDELKLKEIKIYKKYYCSLCDTLSKEYGVFSRLILNYDMTFMAICMDAIEDIVEPIEFRCPINPVKKINVDINTRVMSYVAFATYYLFYKKIGDNVTDSRGLLRFFFKILEKCVGSNRRYKKRLKEYTVVTEKANKHFSMVMYMESHHEEYMVDELLNEFGELIKSLFLGYYSTLAVEEDYKERIAAVSELCFNLGKWIYLMDALDDYNSDAKKRNFNLLNCLHIESNDNLLLESICNRVKSISSILVSKMIQCYSGACFKRNKSIVHNIISLGCSQKISSIINTKYMIKDTKERRK